MQREILDLRVLQEVQEQREQQATLDLPDLLEQLDRLVQQALPDQQDHNLH